MRGFPTLLVDNNANVIQNRHDTNFFLCVCKEAGSREHTFHCRIEHMEREWAWLWGKMLDDYGPERAPVVVNIENVHPTMARRC